MGWNGSDGKKAAAQPKRTSKPAWQKGLAAGAIVVVAALGIVYFLRPEATEEEEEKKPSNALIGEVEPYAPAAVATEEKVEKTPEVVTNYNEKGVWYDDKGRPHYKPARIIYPGSNTVINGERWIPPRPIFKHMSEVELDRVLSIEPGERILGETNWKLFEKDLKESMADPIRIEPDDTPEEIERKNMVKDAKRELAQAIGSGEDPCKILREAQEEANNLANFYDNLNSELYELRTNGEATEAEIEDYVAAANKMLESKNILSKRFYSPKEIRAKAEAAMQRRLEKQARQKLNQ